MVFLGKPAKSAYEAGSFKNQNLGRFLCHVIQFPKGATIFGAQSSPKSQMKGENHPQNITHIRTLHFIYGYFYKDKYFL